MTTILVIDDEPLIAMAVQAALEDEGYEILTAANGKQGLERLAQQPRPDLILLDMMMPVMSGATMLLKMAEQPELRDIPVIILSSLPEEAVKTRAQNVFGLLRKPYSFDDLIDMIGKALGSR